jgi:hypothetical protein
MIKRLSFVTRQVGLSVLEFAPSWLRAVAQLRHAPADVLPLRAVACITLHHVAGTEAPHDGISIAWFADQDALSRFEAWLATEQGGAVVAAEGVVEPSATAVIVAEELVMRGADWLARRWTSGAPKLKHMALARRAEGLSAAEFSARWRGRPGVVGGARATPVITIPDHARGHAYVQNHPLRDAAAHGASAARYDAINEVYFDDLVAMQSRIEFFRQHDVGRADADLVSEAIFVAVEERVIAGLSILRGDEL